MGFWFFITAIASLVVSYYLAPRPPTPQDRDPRREFNTPTAESGRPIPVVYGTVNITSPNVLHFTDKSSIREGNKAHYRLSIHYGLCQGADDILRIRLNEKSLFDTSGSVFAGIDHLDLPEFSGGSEQQGGIEGRIVWQDGALDQTIPSTIAAKYDDAVADLSSYRGVTTLMFLEQDGAEHSGFYWGQSPFIPPVDLMVRNHPGNWYANRAVIDQPTGVNTSYTDPLTERVTAIGPDMNPIHIIRDVMTNDLYGCKIPTDFLDDTSFMAAADALYDEGFGLSILWETSQTGEAFVQDLLDQIEAVIYVSRHTGLFTIKALRGDYDEADLDEYDESNSRVTNLTRGLPGESVNEIVIKWTNPVTEKSESVVSHNLAAAAQAGATISATRDFIGIRNGKLAFRVAEREMAALTEELLIGDVELNRRAWNITAGAVFKLTSERFRLDSEIVRALGVDYGTPGDPTIKVRFLRDVFGATKPDFEQPGHGEIASPPRNFNVTVEDGAVLLDWDTPLNDGGSPILLYEYQQNSGSWQQANGTTTQYRVIGLTNGTEYSFRVRAVTLVGPGKATPPITINPEDLVPQEPNAPRNFRANSIGTEVVLYWDEPISDGGATIIRYEYELDDSGSWRAIVLTAPNMLTYRISNLTLDQEYEIRLRAVNSVGNGTETRAVHVVLRDFTQDAFERPPQAEGLTGRGGILVSLLFWDNPFSHYQNHGETIVYRGTVDTFASSTELGRNPGVSFTDDSLTAGGDYFYWIVWVSVAGTLGPESESVEVSVAGDPIQIITDASFEILQDPLTTQLLSRIESGPAFENLRVEKNLLEQYLSFYTDNYFNPLSGVVGDLETDFTAVQVTVGGFAVTVAALVDSVMDAEGNITVLDGQYSSLAVRVGEVEIRVVSIQTEVDAVEVNVASITVAVDAIDLRVTSVQTEVDAVETNVASIQIEVGAVETSVVSIQTEVDDLGDEVTRVDGVTQVLRLDVNAYGDTIAQWEVKTDVDDLVGGIGLYNDGTEVKLYIAADKFAIIPTDSLDTDDALLPFIVQWRSRYLLIRRSSVTRLSDLLKQKMRFLENLTVVHGELAHARIAEGNIFDLTVGNVIQSSDFVTGVSGWRIPKDGQAEFDAAAIRGILSADHIDSDVLTKLDADRRRYKCIRAGRDIELYYFARLFGFYYFAFIDEF